MKRTRFKQLTLLALVGLGMIQGSAQAAPNSESGEVLVGFRATAGVGATTNYVIDLGQVANLKALTDVTVLPLSGVLADLNTAYGAGWHARTDIFWGAVSETGNTQFSGVGDDPGRTLYATKPETTNGTVAAPWQRLSGPTQGSTASSILSVRSRFNISTAATNAATDTAVTMSTTDSSSWSSYQPGGSNSSGIGFALWSPQIDANPGTYLDLFRMEPGSGDGTLVGRMVLNSNATITFVPAALVGTNVVQLRSATYSAAENIGSGKLTVTVTRRGDTTIAASVTISSSEDSATDPEDYTQITNQTVSFAAGESSKDVLIDIVNRPGLQGNRSFNVTLGGASGSTTLGAQTTAVCTINDFNDPSTVAFQSAVFSANQGATTVAVTLARTGGSSAFTVNLATTDDTAVAGVDYTAPATTVNIPSNQNTVTVNITLIPTGTTQHRQFNIGLSNASGGNSVGTQSTGVVRILATDANNPTVAVTSPAANARVNENGGNTVNIIGSASDDKGLIDRVEIRVNGGSVINAALNTTASGASFSESVPVVGGLNTVSIQAFDARNNASTALIRTFTYVKLRALNVVVAPNSTRGTVTGLKAGVVYEVGKAITLTAKANPGFAFDNWAATGLSGAATEVAALNVIFTDAMAGAQNTIPTFTATFVTNPFPSNVVGDFNGLVIEDGTNDASNATNGSMSLKVTGTGTFTGTLKIDGFTLSIAGLFDNAGVAKFGAARTTTLFVPRTNKPAYELTLNMDLATSGNSNKITGTLKQKYRSALVSNSNVVLDRSAFSATNPVPAGYLLNKGLYNVVLPARASQPGLVAADYPQGDGVGSITVTNVGSLKFTGTLADGTVVTSSSFLSKDRVALIFAQLYTGTAGSIGGLVTLNDTLPDSDVAGTNFFWFRPWQNVHHYPWGWPEGIAVDLVGTKFAVPVGASVLPLLPNLIPNATLSFSDGLLTAPVVKDVTITPTNVVTNSPLTDTSFKLTITAASGKIGGTFTHTDGTKPAFNGVILQKGANRAAFGYFLTVAPKVITGLGESGAVSLIHK